jgi:uncharacterized protein (TIGR02118 family)
MITLSITYPLTEGAPFDWDYYVAKHLPMVGETFKPFGLTFASVLRGIEAVGGGPAPYVVTVLLTFSDDEAARNAIASQGAKKLREDLANFTTIKPVLQFNTPVS